MPFERRPEDLPGVEDVEGENVVLGRVFQLSDAAAEGQVRVSVTVVPVAVSWFVRRRGGLMTLSALPSTSCQEVPAISTRTPGRAAENGPLWPNHVWPVR
jgi:hypothetical protein